MLKVQLIYPAKIDWLVPTCPHRHGTIFAASGDGTFEVPEKC